MNLRLIRGVLFICEEVFHFEAFLTNFVDFFEEFSLGLKDLLMNSIFHEGGKVKNVSVMIFILVVVILDLFVWVLEVFLELFHPFGDDSQDRV